MESSNKSHHHPTIATGLSVRGELALDPPVLCKLCLCEYSLDGMTTLEQCDCFFCTVCLMRYVELMIREGCGSPITCPELGCPKNGVLQDAEIACLVPADVLQLYQQLKFEREVHLDPSRTWCPRVQCQAVCQIDAADSHQAVPVQCPSCHVQFCSICKANWHSGQACQESQPFMSSKADGAGVSSNQDTDDPIKQCPVCHIFIERNEGCAQMMCKNCKHTFCWYCLHNLDVVGILFGLGLIVLVTSPLLLLASPCIICCACKSFRSKRKHHGPPST